MKRAMRFLTLVLCILLAYGLTVAFADMVTVGITLTGVIPGSDGSVRTVVPEGEFRVWQNGEEVGVIKAGRGTLTLNTRERIRIEPVPQSFAPEWDLSTAYITPELSDDSAQIIEITITSREAQIITPAPETTPTPAPAETPVAEISESILPEETPAELPGENTAAPESAQQAGAEISVVMPVSAENRGAPALSDYQAVSLTPEPELPGFDGREGTGSLRVQIFFDKNGNGSQGDYEYGISDLTVYLLDEDERPLTSAVTDADGFAVFQDLPAGRYRTRINLPGKWYFTPFGGENSLVRNAYNLTPAGSQSSGVFEIADGRETEQGVGIHNNATGAAGFCWLEDEVDGLYTENEKKIAGIKVQLKSKDGDIVCETETDAEGNWSISNLRPGFYILSSTGRDGLMLTRYTQSRGRRSYLTSDNPRRQMELKADEITPMNLGFNFASQIYGICYLDANYNGLYDEGETPLPGVKLGVKFIYDGADASSAVSGEDGRYVLDGLRGNQYSMQVMLPADGSRYTKTAPENPLGNRFAQRGERRENEIQKFQLGDMEQLEINIGAIYPGSVSGTVYYDDNFSAAPDGGEKTVSGFTVNLLDADGSLAATARTGADGTYKLENLTPGEYSLEVTAAAGYAFTKQGEGNVILNRTGGQGYSEPFRVELGEDLTGRNIGMILPGTVQGAVFADLNDNGIRDEGEDGMTGSLVRLISETEGEAFRAEIGEDGGFLFDAVMPGRYYIEYSLPEGAVFARVTNGGNEITESELTETGSIGRSDSFDFATGQKVGAPVCGALTLGRIEGIAYQDHDGNGRMEGEETLSGMSVRLIPSRRELDEISAETGEDGTFVLEDLRPDRYTLEVICPDGAVVSRTDSLKLPLAAGKAAQEVSLNVRMGDEWLNQQIGAVHPATLSGQVWLDENNNGRFDEGERTPEGIRLNITDESTGSVFDTPVTDGEGRFSAAGMIPGIFSVSMEMDVKTVAPKDGDSMFRQDGDELVLGGIALEEGETREGLLLGFVRYTSVTGHAWIDRGDEIESLGGVEIVMKNSEGETIKETRTDSSGNYRLDKLMPGTFVLEVMAPEGCVIIEPDDPRLSGTLRSVVTHPSNRLGSTDETELKMDQDLSQMDVGCVLPGRLGDYCWLDLNGDGLQAGDEPGLANVRIELIRNGNVVTETTTDQYGFWRFVDLYPATYTLRVYAPKEVKPTRHRTDLPIIASVMDEEDQSPAVSIELTVESNRNQYNADLGFVCREEGVLPENAGVGEKQDWTPKY